MTIKGITTIYKSDNHLLTEGEDAGGFHITKWAFWLSMYVKLLIFNFVYINVL